MGIRKLSETENQRADDESFVHLWAEASEKETGERIPFCLSSPIIPNRVPPRDIKRGGFEPDGEVQSGVLGLVKSCVEAVKHWFNGARK